MEQNKYIYRPVRFYLTTFIATWVFWSLAIIFKNGTIRALGMLLGLLSPSVIAVITVFTSKSESLKKDFKRKVINFYQLKPLNMLIAIITFTAIVSLSILLSTAFGQSLNQFAFTDDFSFNGAGISSALLTILLASVIEEIGWRGYGEDSVAQYCTWFVESIIFGCVWAMWHLPLFWIQDTYQYGLRVLGIGYMLNFLISVVPFGFLTTWVYVKNRRSMLASMIFHLFVNFMQERIAMTPQTKCVETIVVVFIAVIVVLTNKNMFFEKDHIGKLPEELKELSNKTNNNEISNETNNNETSNKTNDNETSININ
ncbi:hypothetical protein BCR32DRAFT_330955 [Anaeromyces robustus]|uniref:CAAX prenyl protease 2/Lysostaphin resistance protein A-like domain-containing protein n=1 Tax=Anaeromyces robustus TaxID=1754192 RepID=A0A1Y1VE63_9FUNG|nr:hypothetical protein BCR32DRAFT_330955 [Anaeromyces robustus]|eukprot:ORX53915.1 hypothetical protein BCR32DRAFT_330955 [Anaeromyces robustus]